MGPKAAKNLNDDEFYAVFTVGIFVIGTALCNIPSGPIFNRYGRHGGFLLGSLCLILGGVLGSISVAVESLALLYISSLSLGLGVGFGQFYRFAAIEVASPDNKGWAVTTVLTGGCFAAFFGPTLGLLTKEIFNAQYAGSYMMMAILGLLNLITVQVISFPPEDTNRPLSASASQQLDVSAILNPVSADAAAVAVSSASHNSTSLLVSEQSHSSVLTVVDEYMVIYVSRTFVNATLVSAIAQILMLIMMIASILKMNDLGFTLLQQALVLDFHFFAMFGTGFITSYLLKQYNIYSVLAIAWALLGVAVLFFLSSHSLWAFFVGDFLVGVGWNIMFSTGTVMLSFSYKPYQRHVVQSFFEILINTISGVFTIVSGIILSVYGWDRVIYGILGIFVALSLVAPVYARYYADPSATYTERSKSASNAGSDIECSALD